MSVFYTVCKLNPNITENCLVAMLLSGNFTSDIN